MVMHGCAHSGCTAQKLAVSYEEINGINSFLRVDINLGKLKVTLIIGPPHYRGSYKITIVCFSVCLSASSAFFSGTTH